MGALVLFVGILCKMGTNLYAQNLFQLFEVESTQLKGHSFSVKDAIFKINAGTYASYLIMVIGVASVFVGVGRIRQVPAPKKL
jgi:hypothetical protein